MIKLKSVQQHLKSFKDIKEDQLAQYEATGEVNRGSADKFVTELGETKNLSQTDEVIIKAVQKQYLQIRKKSLVVENLQGKIAAVMDYSTLKENGDNDERIKFWNDYIVATNDLRSFLDKGYVRGLSKEINASSLSSSYKKQAVSKVNSEWKAKKKNILKVRDLDVEFSEVNKKILLFLNGNPDAWLWDVDSDQVNFYEDADIDTFNSMIDRISEIADEQDKTQRAVLSE